jgi:hypothetical protein
LADNINLKLTILMDRSRKDPHSIPPTEELSVIPRGRGEKYVLGHPKGIMELSGC